MSSLRVNCASHPSFSSAGSGSSGYFTPVCGLIVKEPFTGKEKHETQDGPRRLESDPWRNCKPKKKKAGFLAKLRKKGSRLCGGKMPVQHPAQIQVSQKTCKSAGKGNKTTTAVMVTSTPAALVERPPPKVETVAIPVEAVAEAPVRKRTFGLGASVTVNEGSDNGDTAASNQSLPQGETESETISVEKLKRMSGLWVQDHSRSDGIEEMCEVLELGWVFRKALEKSDVLELDINDVRIAQIAKIFRLVDLVEKFPLSGEEQTFRRRDLRRGPLHAQTNLTKRGYSTRLWWDDPCKGGMTETFYFTPDGREMEIDVYIWRETGRQCRLRTVWKRS